MKVIPNKISNVRYEVSVEVPADDFEKYLSQAAANLSKDLELQGFRRGHAPRNMVERAVGTDKVWGEAAELAVRGTFSGVLKEAGLHTDKFFKRAAPEIQMTKLAPHNPFEYKVTLHVPFFELTNDYEKIASKIRNHEKESAEDRTQVEEKEVDNALVWFAKSRKVEAINDDFAKTIGNFTSLEGLKESIREGIRIEKESQEKERVRHAVLREIVSKSQKEIPNRVIEGEILKIEEEFMSNISSMGLDFDAYLAKINKTREELYNGWREKAKERIENFFALDLIAEKKEIQASEDEVEREAQKVLNHYKNSKDAEKLISAEALRDYAISVIRNEKAFQFLESV